MGYKAKAEEDITPECEENGILHKKRKMDSLLLEVDSRNLVKLHELVKRGVDVKITGNFLLSDQQRFVDILHLFTANISDHLAIIDILVGMYSYLPVLKNKENPKGPDCLILPSATDTEQHIEALELVGAAFVFHENECVPKHGWSCWKKALELRVGNGIPKTTLPQSEWETRALGNEREFNTDKELNKLLRQKRTYWKTQAFFISQRILKKYGCFPNQFIVYSLFKFALQGWKELRWPRSRSFAISLYLFELFGTTEFLHKLVLNPAESNDVLHRTFTEFFNTLDNHSWNKDQLTRPGTVLTFDNLMTSLDFLFTYQVRLHDYGPKHQIKIDANLTIKSKSVKLDEITELILLILKLLVVIQKSKTQSRSLKSKLAIYINVYELKRANKKPNLLLIVCDTFHVQTNEFKLIKLLLKAGANPNAVDQNRCSPLHLLAKKERELSTLWDTPFYRTRAENFTSIVRAILDGRFHEDQVNLRGQSALECLKSRHHQYPNAQLRQLLNKFCQGVRPLSCIAAKVVRKHRLPCEELPVTLQDMVLQH